MPPRYAYWTIIAGGLPTAFRTTEREALLPTFRRIKQKHPDAEMKYFARGRLWTSPGEAKAETERLRAEADARRSAGRPSRGRTWRPGGDHQDPRQKFKDAKKVRNQDRRQERFERKHKTGAPPSGGGAPTGRAPQSPRPPRAEWRDRPRNDRGPRTARPPARPDRLQDDRPPRDSARQDRPQRDGRDQHGFRGKPPAARDRPWNDRGDKPFRTKSSSGDDRRPPSARPAPRSASKPGGGHGSTKESWGRKPESKSRTSGPGGRPSGRPAKGRDQRGPAKDRRRR